MTQQVRWVRQKIECPEGRGDTELLAAWRGETDQAVLTGISCDNPQLKDLSWTDCQWSCWEEISEIEE